MKRLAMAGKTDTGKKRSRNEDAIAWDLDRGYAILADGMGGHNSGDLASAIAVQTLKESLDGGRGKARISDRLRLAVKEANSRIRECAGERPELSGMGTTVVVARFDKNGMTVAHVGDSRIYRFRKGKLEQLTVDHSLVQELVKGGFMTPEEARVSQNRNIITRALGSEPEVEVDVQYWRLRAGDMLLLCSDGLSDLVEDTAIQNILQQSPDLDSAADSLVHAANEQGGTDNISVILVGLH